MTYWKLEKIFENFVPDTVILGFSPHNISQFNDLKFSDKTWSNEMFKRSYAIADIHELDIDVDHLGYNKTLWKQTAFFPKKNHHNMIGSFKRSKENKINDWRKVVRRHYSLEGKELGVSETQIDYLNRMVDLCETNNVVLILTSHPLHQSYLNEIPSRIYKRYQDLMNEFEKEHVVINKSKETYPDELFLNVDHLNEYGADRFTKEVVAFLKN